jgi:hypothetical protein
MAFAADPARKQQRLRELAHLTHSSITAAFKMQRNCVDLITTEMTRAVVEVLAGSYECHFQCQAHESYLVLCANGHAVDTLTLPLPWAPRRQTQFFVFL